MSFNPNAQTGFAAASHYDAHRPSFPAESVEVLLKNCRVSGEQGAVVVDLAAGTGKFTEILAARPEKYKIIAIEPHDDMRAVLEQKKLPGVKVRKGLAHDMGLPNGSVDAVIAAQAWHWFANMDSLKEIHSVLQETGVFGMIWNIEDYNAPQSHQASSSWEKTMQDFIWKQDDNSPRFRHEKWRTVFDEQLAGNPISVGLFATPIFALPLGEYEEKWEVWLNEDRAWDRINSLSQVSILKGQEREAAVKLFKDAIAAKDTPRNEKGEIVIHGSTFSAWSSKIPA